MSGYVNKIAAVVVCLLLSMAVYATDLSDVGNNIIRDADNELEWIKFSFGPKNWTNHTATADGLTYAGRSDWRLPTKTELLLLVNSTHDPKIDPLFDLGPVSRWTCWTSTSASSGRTSLTKKYAVFFGDGQAITVPYQSHKAALYVRDYEPTALEWHDGSNITYNSGDEIEFNSI